MRIIFDTNIWISFLIGKELSQLESILRDPKIKVCYCHELEQEFLEVAHRVKIRKYVDENHIKTTHDLLTKCCRFKIINKKDIPVRDSKDAYLLELSEIAKADLLITGDGDLLAIKNYCKTKIVCFAEAVPLIKQTIVKASPE